MVYLLRAVRWVDPTHPRYDIAHDRPRLFCRAVTATRADVRVMSAESIGIRNTHMGGETWWVGWLLEDAAARLLAQGRVREVSLAELLHVAGRLAVGEDGVIR